MIPYEDLVTVREIAFGRHHEKCCCSKERALGVLNPRFKCICKQCGGAIPLDIEVDCPISMSCIAPYNYFWMRNMDLPEAADIWEDIRKEGD